MKGATCYVSTKKGATGYVSTKTGAAAITTQEKGVKNHQWTIDRSNEQTEIDDDEHASPQLVTIMKGKPQRVFRISQHRCIYKVPKSLRDVNEAAYVPRLVSLGPIHHGKKGLEAMEDYKWRCFEGFIGYNSIDLDALVRLMKRHEEETRGFYAECITLSSDDFVQVMLVDAIFVINFLLEFQPPNSASPVSDIYYDEDFFSFQVHRDMLLLENQLPFFILKKILDFAKSTNGTTITERRSNTELTRSYIKTLMDNEGVTGLNCCEVMHLVDFQTLYYLPTNARRQPKYEGEFKKIKSITELHEAGVKFLKAEGKELLDIEFDNGKLTIPPIDVSDSTETIFRNVLAYDQCHHGSSHITDYFVLMGMLIDTDHDVELLVKNDILKNQLATNQEVSKVFNNLEKEVIYRDSFYYSHRCKKINDYCEIRCHKWMATLKQNYLDTPWKVISVIAASILVVLTMIQTVCSIISL